MRTAALLAAIHLFSCAVCVAAANPDFVAVRVPLDTDEKRCAGCMLVRVDPEGQLAVLTEGFFAAKDPSVSFDGRSFDYEQSLWTTRCTKA